MGRVEQWHSNLTTYGLIPYIITATWFFVRIGDRDKALDWEYIKALFRAVSPYFWASLGMYISISMSVLGAAWYVHAHPQRSCPSAVAFGPREIALRFRAHCLFANVCKAYHIECEHGKSDTRCAGVFFPPGAVCWELRSEHLRLLPKTSSGMHSVFLGRCALLPARELRLCCSWAQAVRTACSVVVAAFCSCTLALKPTYT
jgi:hypothetical protein